jgi:catalase
MMAGFSRKRSLTSRYTAFTPDTGASGLKSTGTAPRVGLTIDCKGEEMAIHPELPANARPRLSTAGTVIRLALIGVALAAVAGTFAYLGGWLTPQALTPARFTDGFEEVNGVYSGFRRNHAKGVSASGFFESNGNGVRLSKAAVFQPGRVPVLGRFSLGGGKPYAPDSVSVPRGLGLQFLLPDGELWRTAMIHLPVFPFRTPEAFYEQLFAFSPDPSTGKPDPAKVQAFLARHPETVEALKFIKSQPAPSGFSDATFHSLNAFRFINAAGKSTPVRWILTPAQSLKKENAATPCDMNFLFDELIAQIHRRPLQWYLIVIVGQPGDPTNDATLPWPAGREQVNVGTLTIDRLESDDTSPERDINFDPLVLPDGIAPTDDPLLSARSAVYSQSFTRRAGELKQPSEITPTEVSKGK